MNSDHSFRFLIKFPSRERPKQFFNTLDAYVDLLSGKHDIQIMATLDEDDASMNNKEIKDRFKQYQQVSVFWGYSQNKIDAVNRDMDKHPPFDILILASDDMVPEIKGYDEIIASKFRTYFPDLDGVTWFNDGNQGGRVNTLCILGKAYYDRFNYIYHPDYASLFCDNEFTDVANMLQKQIYIDQVIIRHQHPIFSSAVEKDELYTRNDMMASLDEQVYITRKLHNFGFPRNGAPPSETRKEDLSNPPRPVDAVQDESNDFLWSILVCTQEGKETSFNKLIQQLSFQIQVLQLQDQIEIMVDLDDGTTPMGVRRNRLVESGQGKYLCFIDDDTSLDGQYIKNIHRGLKEEPDVVTIQGTLTSPKFGFRLVIHTLENKKFEMVNGIYQVPPNHRDIIRKDIAQRFPFPENLANGDEVWALQLIDNQVLNKAYTVSVPVYSTAWIEKPAVAPVSVKSTSTKTDSKHGSGSSQPVTKEQDHTPPESAQDLRNGLDLNDQGVINQIIWG